MRPAFPPRVPLNEVCRVPVDKAHPYAGLAAVLATRHGKERALNLPMRRLGLSIRTVPDLDTDSLGTFSGEIARRGTPLETVIAKARLGMKASGLPLALANEGSFGPHPANPFVPADFELLVLVDDERGIIVKESLLSHRTCHSEFEADHLDAFLPWLHRIGFPRQAVIVRPANAAPGEMLFKGLADEDSLARAIERCATASVNGRVVLQPDLRAHHSPQRMRLIRQLGWRMAARLASLCPACRSPGYGWLESRRGLPCGGCRAPTRLVLTEIHGCSRCPERQQQPPGHGLVSAEPGYCDYCNP